MDSKKDKERKEQNGLKVGDKLDFKYTEYLRRVQPEIQIPALRLENDWI